MRLRKTADESGSILIFFVITVAVVTSLMFAAVRRIRSADVQSVHSYQSTQAYYLAESGLSWAKSNSFDVDQKINCFISDTDRFEISLITKNGDIYIRSIGYSGEASRILDLLVTSR